MFKLPAIITFAVYLLFLVGVGVYFYRRTAGIEDYLLGGRKLGKWVTAISAQASDMSGWLLMGLPGAVYLGGIPAVWIALGLFIGTWLNWRFVSVRLRIYTGKTGALTLPSFFETRFRDPTGLLRTVSAIIILLFFTIYTSSGLVASGRLFEAMFGIEYHAAVLIGASVIVAYTFLGGFLAVSWTDLFQGTLMFIAIVAVPAAAYHSSGGSGAVATAMAERGIPAGLIPPGPLPLLAVASAMAWGLGYFGQPHILARFMGIRSARELPRAMAIALVWVAVSLTGAVIAGLLAIPSFPGLAGGEQEKVFIYLIGRNFGPWLGGIMLAAILSAIMSTIDSQLLVSSSALTEDFYKKVIKKNAAERELVLMGRICVLIISAVALIMAMNPENTVLGLVAYAWAGFGAAFGPLVLFSLFSKRTSWRAALAGLVAGTVTLILWKQLGLGERLYEIVPGFLANTAAILAVNYAKPQKTRIIMEEFRSVKDEAGERYKTERE